MKRLGKLPVSAPNLFGISISLETIFNLFKRFVLLKQNQLKKKEEVLQIAFSLLMVHHKAFSHLSSACHCSPLSRVYYFPSCSQIPVVFYHSILNTQLAQ